MELVITAVILNCRLSLSGIKYHVVWENFTDVSEEYTAAIVMVEGCLLAACFLLATLPALQS
jgi:hypothetical protein